MEKYKGIYDSRVVGLYNGKFVYYEKESGYVIERKYWKKPTKEELKEINEKFGDLEKKKELKDIKEKPGDLEKKVKEFRII